MITGKTTEGKFCYGEIFKFSDTYGLPLDMILEELEKENGVVDWEQYYKDAKKAGWRKDTIIKKIKMDITNSDLKDRVVKYFQSMLEDKNDIKVKGRIFKESR